jgi:tetratricopeptide (TPR) repeat protein
MRTVTSSLNRALRLVAYGLLVLLAQAVPGEAQWARISEERRSIGTYPFGEANPVPILTRDRRLYPYHSFEGYSTGAEPRDWTVVRLENEWIEVFVLPEVGGKVWGAVVKETGHEFIYRNEVLKFRNIALRGPWTSGGIEFNFGVIGHTPATATPVDYTLVENDDGSVSCIVGAMDLPSRTHWRVEIRLPADRATFETRVLWYNPTPLEQPYYNWMTGAAFARDDLVMTIPGNAYLEHSGQARDWPTDPAGRDLSVYRNNTFAGHKSYHVVGELNDFFGGYYREDDYGFGHWARYEDMPGQKLWLWALSREGGVWEDLLTDTDGQYVEFQAGRLLVQYSPGDAVNPITQAGFDPLSASRWTESWFPLEGMGGLTEASRDGALHLERQDGEITVSLNAFRAVSDTLRVWVGGELVAAEPVVLEPLEPARVTVEAGDGARVEVSLAHLGLHYDTDPADRTLTRPFATDPGAVPSIPETDRLVFQAREDLKGRWHAEARAGFDAALEREPWHREALLGAAELDYRNGRSEAAMARVSRVLQLDAYDAQANFMAGIIHRDLGMSADAHDAFAWATRSTGTRSAAYAQLAEMALERGDWGEAVRYAHLSLDFDRHGIPGWRVLAVAGRLAGDPQLAARARAELLEIDPLHHFALAEAWLSGPAGSVTAREARQGLLDGVGGEYPDQTLLEIAAAYTALGRAADALRVLDVAPDVTSGPVSAAWRAYLRNDPTLLSTPTGLAFAFPYRRETLAVLAWAVTGNEAWEWRYLLALNLWAVDRDEEALALLEEVGGTPAFAPFHVVRAHLAERLRGSDPTPGLQRAVALEPETRTFHVLLVRALLESHRWQDALAGVRTARERFPGDFNLALLESRALLEGGRGAEAARILDAVQVLPSENARESHSLYAQAHTLTALDRLEASDPEGARAALGRALEWPETLGQGRPYEPEERLVRFLLAHAAAQAGDVVAARAHYAEVAGATPRRPGAGEATRLDLLGLAARSALGEAVDLGPIKAAPDALFQGVEGRLVERALRLEGVR